MVLKGTEATSECVFSLQKKMVCHFIVIQGLVSSYYMLDPVVDIVDLGQMFIV